MARSPGKPKKRGSRFGGISGLFVAGRTLASTVSEDRPLGKALAPGGTVDRALDTDGPLDRLLARGGALDRLLEKDGFADRMLEPDGPVDRLLRKDGPLDRLLAKGGHFDRLLEEGGALDRLLEEGGVIDQVVNEGGLIDRFMEVSVTLGEVGPTITSLHEPISSIDRSAAKLATAVGPLSDIVGRFPTSARLPGMRRRTSAKDNPADAEVPKPEDL
ncbi:hypothetical protein IEU95_04660 [Hoyosella rhizosphaerae]|uniref:Uncharacterized protein n=1 Tax=Hoyosella rhizosphaerae TaxID=1755582 RepID=A0A916UA89_9ACTN|nr:hypothetical protein [Hoyosella rhizosphaerae]MBN4926108.1 hypothetical protein [Hoyosella rhizosphaerae]GGC65520.1 hypothetical protein GCM10011410_17490 [Hoyosella rhizosphaerae]